MAYRAKIGSLVAEEMPVRATPPEKLGDEGGTVDGSVRVNRREGWIMVDTPRTSGGFVDHPGVVRTAQLSADVSASNTSVWASSLDMKPLAGRIIGSVPAGDDTDSGTKAQPGTVS